MCENYEKKHQQFLKLITRGKACDYGLKRVAITITLKPKLYEKTITTQFQALRRNIHKYLGHADYKFSIELTEGLNIHAHGVMHAGVDTYKRLMRLRTQGRHCIGFMKVVPIFNLGGWNQYCLKHYELMAILSQEHDIEPFIMPPFAAFETDLVKRSKPKPASDDDSSESETI